MSMFLDQESLVQEAYRLWLREPYIYAQSVVVQSINVCYPPKSDKKDRCGQEIGQHPLCYPSFDLMAEWHSINVQYLAKIRVVYDSHSAITMT